MNVSSIQGNIKLGLSHSNDLNATQKSSYHILFSDADANKIIYAQGTEFFNKNAISQEIQNTLQRGSKCYWGSGIKPTIDVQEGDIFIDVDEEYVYSYNNSTWIPRYSLRGNYGIQGVKGILGAQGLTGIIGMIGMQGVTGAQGIQGPTGFTGAFGRTGAQGTKNTVQGITGIQGRQGAQGSTGAQGLKGKVGLTGAFGRTGAQGTDNTVQGITGVQGRQGAQGSTGTQGLTGDTMQPVLTN